jgi:hypothetical protein
MSRLYVYAFTNGPAALLRLGKHRIQFIELHGIHAAVERVADRPAVSEEALRAQHAIVLEIAESVEAIVPARFGALMDRKELEAIVSMRIRPIREALDLVAGRVQMTVRVFQDGVDIAAGRGDTATCVTGTEYLEQRRRRAVATPAGAAAAISGAVRQLVREERTRQNQGRARWTLYHLVDRTAVSQYEHAVKPFESAAVVVSGPWPPFAFVPDLWP